MALTPPRPSLLPLLTLAGHAPVPVDPLNHLHRCLWLPVDKGGDDEARAQQVAAVPRHGLQGWCGVVRGGCRAHGADVARMGQAKPRCTNIGLGPAGGDVPRHSIRGPGAVPESAHQPLLPLLVGEE